MVCGDGTLSLREECDDGNVTDGDGCSAACTFESVGPGDVCPGEPIELDAIDSARRIGSVSGTTTMLAAQYGATCGGSGAERVYVYEPDVDGWLSAAVTADFDVVAYARTTCGDGATENACSDVALDGPEILELPVVSGEPVYLFVDGYAGDEGTFRVDVDVREAHCGNGVAEPSEACDDGNLLAGDGCSATCGMEIGDAAACPGATLLPSSADPSAPRHVGVLGDTSEAGLPSALKSEACGGSGAEAVHRLVPDVDGSLTVSLFAGYDDAVLYVQTSCDDAAVERACSKATSPFEPITLTIPVTADDPVFVIADSSMEASAGPFALDMTITPAECGNGNLDGGETCDDGNLDEGDGCDTNCDAESTPAAADTCPGQALVLSGSPPGAILTASTSGLGADEQEPACAANPGAHDAVYSVSAPFDGLLSIVVDPQFAAALYVRASCDVGDDPIACVDEHPSTGVERAQVPVVAGSTYYVMVDGVDASDNGTFELAVELTPSSCGNGVMEGGEACDDGNVSLGDGCGADCAFEPPGAADGCPAALLDFVPSGTGLMATVVGSTANLTNKKTVLECGGEGPDAVYQFDAPFEGTIVATVTSASFDVTLSTGGSCGMTGSSSCFNSNHGAGYEMLRDTVEFGGLLFVDGASANDAGPFELEVKLVPRGCGDGFLFDGEECDDFGVDAGDGCSPTCTLEANDALNETCMGEAITLFGNDPAEARTAFLTTDLSVLQDDERGSCGGTGPDAVYRVTTDIAGTLTASVFNANTSDTRIYARTSCIDPGTEIACAELENYGVRGVSFPVLPYVPYYLIVDTNGDGTGATLNLTVSP